MEIYNVYEACISLFSRGDLAVLRGNFRPFLLAACTTTVILLALFVLEGIGVYTMAKKRNVSKRWLAFVPFANLWLIGRLTGPCDVFGRKMKRAGVYAMIAQIVAFALCLSSMIAEFSLFYYHGDTMLIDPDGYAFWETLPRSGMIAYNYYNVAEYLVSIATLVQTVFIFILMMGLYKKYSVKNYMPLSWLCLFVPLSRFVVVFILRNNAAIDYDAYMRRKREEYARRASSYGNPYAGGYNPYAGRSEPYGQSAPTPPAEPFSEFSEEKNAGEPFSEFSSEKSAPAEPFAEFSAQRQTSDYTAERPQKSDEPPTKSDGDDLFD